MKMDANKLWQEPGVFELKMFRLDVDFHVFPVARTAQKFCGVH
jgi:hypothetical protein